ncbi:HEAT repeat domain-containing protein [Streptomyces sp. NPDC091280]|uniref:HEAT repeat domain-containing protein n=1 Tax=Streptomyces sp. NPDC091280 TaxID=3365984 RepID=UPI003827C273
MPFTRQFLIITSRAAGLPPAEQERRWKQAGVLLRALSEERADQRVLDQPGAPESGSRGDEVARLRLQLDLARAQHTVTQLDYALRDTQVFVATLWNIINALREIISGRHHDQIRLAHAGGPAAQLAELHSDTERALDYKRAAQAEADRALARLKTLEDCWEQAHAQLHRLSQLPDAAQTATGHPAGAPPLPAVELFAEPALDALDDIKSALEKAHTVNARGDEQARTLYRVLDASQPPSPDDERLVLVAATRLSHPDSRRTALATLVEHWTDHPDTRAVLLRLASDPEWEVRCAVATGLGECWWEEDAPCDTLARLAQDEHSDVRNAAAHSLFRTGWRDDQARAVVLGLAQDTVALTRTLVALGLSEWWPQMRGASTVLLELLLDSREDPGVRYQAAQGLLRNWIHTPETRDAFLRIATDHDSQSAPTSEALSGILAHWLHDPLARNVVLRLSPVERVFGQAQQYVTESWRGEPVTRDLVIRLSETDDTAVLNALATGPDAPVPAPDPQHAAERAAQFRAQAMDMLSDGWAGDSVARDAVLRRVDDPSPHVRTRAGVALCFGWSEDAAARNALDALAQDREQQVRDIIAVELRWGEQNGTPPGTAL